MKCCTAHTVSDEFSTRLGQSGQKLSLAVPKGPADASLMGVFVSSSLDACRVSKEFKKEAVRLRKTSLLGTGIPASCSLFSRSDVDGMCLMLPSSRPTIYT